MDIKHKQLYIVHDKYAHMFKIGSATDVTRRVAQLSSTLKRPLELIATMPGHDYFLSEIPISRAQHPTWHKGEKEWYHDTPETRAFIQHLISISSTLDVTRVVTETWMHKYTE